MSCSAGDIRIGVGLDPQQAYEDAVAMASAFLAFAADLERTGRVRHEWTAGQALRALAPAPALPKKTGKIGTGRGGRRG